MKLHGGKLLHSILKGNKYALIGMVGTKGMDGTVLLKLEVNLCFVFQIFVEKNVQETKIWLISRQSVFFGSLDSKVISLWMWNFVSFINDNLKLIYKESIFSCGTLVP